VPGPKQQELLAAGGAGPASLDRREADIPRADAAVGLSISRADLDVDRQIQLDEARLQLRHRQVIAQFDPCVRIARRSSELFEGDLASLPKRRPCAA
jgi:hypothetical protein